jgi:hypothetical protein
LDIRKDNISPRYLQAHCQSRTSRPADQSFVKELAKPTQEKRNFKKCPTARQKTMKMQQQIDRQTTADKEALVVTCVWRHAG